MRLGGGELLFGGRLEQILETGNAIFENEIEFAFLIVHEIVEQANDVLVVHFAEELDFHADVVFAVRNLA